MERLESAKEALSRLGITATTPRLVIADILFERQEHPTARNLLIARGFRLAPDRLQR